MLLCHVTISSLCSLFQVEVKRALPRDDSNPMAHARTKKVFLGGLSPDTTREDIQEVLDQHGKVSIFTTPVSKDMYL